MALSKITHAQRPQMGCLEKVKEFFKDKKVQKALKLTGIALAAIAAIAASFALVAFTSPLSVPIAITGIIIGNSAYGLSVCIAFAAARSILNK